MLLCEAAEPPLKPHDLGGLPGGPVVAEAEDDHAPWERRVDALVVLLIHPGRRVITMDEIRRVVEGLGEDGYRRMAYYERWMHAVATALVERGVLTTAEIGRRLAEVQARGPAA